MKKCVLGDLMEVTRGASLAGKYYATSGEKVRLTLANFDYSNNCFKADTSKDNIYYTQEVEDRFLLQEGDIITPLTEQTPGLLGTTARIPESGKYIQSQDVALLRPFEDKLDPDFCFYLVSSKSVREQLGAMSQQTKIRHSSPDKIKGCTVFLPDIVEQKRIGRFLTTIDRKIALNRKRIATLEAMAKEIYDYWFVQFDFPDAHGRPYKSSGGAMVYNSELKREIPKGWEVKALGEISTFRNGINYEKSEIGDAEYRIVNVRNISESTFLIRHEDLDKIILRQTLADRFLLRSEDIIVARSGTPGATRIILNPERTIFCGFIICCSPIQKAHQILLMQRLQSIQESLLDTSGGSILKNVSQDTLKSIQVELPPDDVLRQFNDTILTVIRSIDNAQRSVVEMSDLRDFLLPLLMNGQVKVG